MKDAIENFLAITDTIEEFLNVSYQMLLIA
jgi:hypothetical protein